MINGSLLKADKRGKVNIVAMLIQPVEKFNGFIWESGDIYRRLTGSRQLGGASTDLQTGGSTKFISEYNQTYQHIHANLVNFGFILG